MLKYLFFIIFLNYHQLDFCQTEKLFHGKVLNEDFPVQGVKVININTEKNIVTNNNGDFAIYTKPNDILVFYALEYNYKRKKISEKEIFEDYIVIELEKKPIQLKEVIVEKNPINATNMGIVSADKKSYTPAERKLQEAKSGVITPLINLISGRTKMLKNHLNIENNEMLLAKISTLFDDEYYTKKLKIPVDYIKAFQYYIVDDKDFITALKSKNKSIIKFLMSKLSVEFNKQIANETAKSTDTIHAEK